MHKTWLIIRHEYLKHVRSRRFLFALVTMPAIILLSIGVGLLTTRMQMNGEPFGYVDMSGILPATGIAELPKEFLEPSVKGIAYKNIESAKADLYTGLLQGIFILPQDFEVSGAAKLIVLDKAGSNLTMQFRRYVEEEFISRLPDANAKRVREGTNFLMRSTDGSRQMESSDWFTFIFPFLSAILFVIVISTSGGYLLLAMIDEKENRTMEIMATSTSASQFLTGKIIGNLMVGLTQLVVWMFFAAIGILSTKKIWGLGMGMSLDSQQIAIFFFVMLPAFVLVAALMTALGASVTEQREAQQVSALFTLPMVSPLWFMQYLLENPNTPISKFLSIFPLTSPVTLPIRAGVTNLSWLDIILSAVVMCISTGFALFVAAQTFRLGMLRYGKRVNLLEIMQSILSGGKPA